MDILLTPVMGKPLWMWGLFACIVTGLLILDLGVLNRGDKEIGVKRSLCLSGMYIALGVAFSGFIWWETSGEAAAQYLTAFVVEKTLALDNIFVIALIFGFFSVPREHQHRVLFWGILGAILMRGVMIGLGSVVIAEYHWVLYVFSAFLIFTGMKMLWGARQEETEADLSRNAAVLFLRRHLRVTDAFHGNAFTVKAEDPATGRVKRYATPLLLALVVIECADLVFAVDSVPAVFTITADPYIVFTSNIFAILGLRSLYFALAAVLHRFAYLKYALAVLLIFIGSKMFVADIMGWEKFPPAWSLGLTFAILGAGVVVSLVKTKEQASTGSVSH